MSQKHAYPQPKYAFSRQVPPMYMQLQQVLMKYKLERILAEVKCASVKNAETREEIIRPELMEV